MQLGPNRTALARRLAAEVLALWRAGDFGPAHDRAVAELVEVIQTWAWVGGRYDRRFLLPTGEATADQRYAMAEWMDD